MSVFDHVAGTLSEIDAQVVAAVPPGGNWRDLPADFPSERVEQIRRSAAAGEGSRSTYYGRLSLDRPSYTISTYFTRPGNGCFIHPTAPRLITVREGARLQSFPDAFRFSGRGRARYVQVGNAVPPLLAWAVGSVLPRGQVVDLFAGVGGLSLGLSLAGHEILLSVDNDRSCIDAVKAHGHALLVQCADLGDVDTVASLAAIVHGRRDSRRPLVLVGGPPCQGFSTAGHNDADDPRNRLAFAFLDAADVLEPDVIVMENVPALMWRGRQHVLDAIVKRLEARGYLVDIAVLHAEAYGVPQLRRRLFLQARREGYATWPAPMRAVCDPAQPSLQPAAGEAVGRAAPTTVGEAIGDLPLGAADDADCPMAYVSELTTGPYSAWARGEIEITDLMPTVRPVTRGPAQLRLRAVA
ncbi:MAG: DNA cytosine methyltransferase [Actinobacteria bacterium]|nr:DNA cytosine methyltransferase [Actinomycetota bacterium]